jgi:inorganic pyrophosphatase
MQKTNLIKHYFFYNLVFIIFFIIFLSLAYAEEKNLISDIYPFNEDETINAVIEIPAGTLEKWEVSKDGSQIVQQIENNKIKTINYLAYPFNYGFIPQTFLPVEEGGDGDQLDIIIIGPNIERGSILKVKPIGTIIVMDNNEIDLKIVSLAVNNLEISRSNSIDDLEKQYLGLFEIIQIWIENYKGEAIEIKNILGKKATKEYIKKYHESFLLSSKTQKN